MADFSPDTMLPSTPLITAPLSLAPDGTAVSERYGDVYHSAAGAVEQSKHVFLAGNGLPARWCRRNFTVLETGFGLGINFLTTWAAWRGDPQRGASLRFISLEKHPFLAADLAIAHAAWPEFAELAALLRAVWPAPIAGEYRLEFDGGEVELRLVFGDALETLPWLNESADAFYLDGFSPAKNPELWSAEIFRHIARLAAPDATLATWSVAGSVRRALTEAGFIVERRPGFSGKRQMLSGRRAA